MWLVASSSGVEPQYDFSVGKRQGALSGERDRIALGRDLDGIDLVDQQDARGMPPQVARRFAGDHLEAAALEQPVHKACCG